MKRMILCLVALLAAGSAFAADAPADQNVPAAPTRLLAAQPPAAQCTSQALPQLQGTGFASAQRLAAATTVSCDQCWAWFGECMEGCWEVGWGPECKNACLAAKNDCLAQCE
jgi:hypothetical protein